MPAPVEIDPTKPLEALPVPETDDDPSPYQRIAADLHGAITCGALRPGDHLPTLAELAERYGVVPSTASRAVAILATEGLVESARGKRAIVLDGRQAA